MSSRKNDARTFADAYYGMSLPRLRIPPSFRRRTQAINTLIIDSSTLTDGALAFGEVWGAADRDVMNDAAHALAHHTEPLAAHLHAIITHPSPAAIPITLYEEAGIFEASYHSGAGYAHYFCGDIESLLRRCDVTENERENIRLMARQQSQTGRLVYGVAQRTTHSPSAPRRELEWSGMLSCSMTLYPGTEAAIARLRDMGCTIVYASQASDIEVMTLAHLSCLTPSSLLPAHHVAHHADAGLALYAELTSAARKKLIASYPAETTLVVTHPLPTFVDLFSASRS